MTLQEICKQFHQEALAARAKMPFTNHGIPFRLRIYDRTGRAFPDLDNGVGLELPEGLNDATRHFLRIGLPIVLSAMKASAIMVQSDVWGVMNKKFGQHFGIPEGLSVDAYHEHYHRIMNEKFGGSMANLPVELRRDAILTGMKGPGFAKPVAFVTTYTADQNDRVVIGETIGEGDSSYGQVNLVPDWWKSTVQ